MVQEIIISVISVFAPQCGLDGSQKDDFYYSLISVVKMLVEKKIVVTAENANGNFESNLECYVDQHEGYSYGVKNGGRGK